MADERQYPDVDFIEKDGGAVLNALIKGYEHLTGRTLYPADPARLFILWMANIIVLERVLYNENAKQNVPRYATGKYLDSIAEIFNGVERLQAQHAKTTMRFYISAAQNSAQTIKKGTKITVDGNITFETVENITIPPGELFGDATAVCVLPGESGNGFMPGQISRPVDLYSFYEKVENITESAGGAETETDEAFYKRMRESMEAYSVAGPEGAYIYHAKTASQKIADVTVLSPSPGVIDVRILLENGELPGEEMLKTVKEALSQDTVRPLTDFVTVSPPDIVYFDIDVKYFIPKPSAASATTIIRDAEKAVDDYINWQTRKMGRDINPSVLIASLMSAGVKRGELSSPDHTKISGGRTAVLRNKNVVCGGVEDE